MTPVARVPCNCGALSRYKKKTDNGRQQLHCPVPTLLACVIQSTIYEMVRFNTRLVTTWLVCSAVTSLMVEWCKNRHRSTGAIFALIRPDCNSKQVQKKQPSAQDCRFRVALPTSVGVLDRLLSAEIALASNSNVRCRPSSKRRISGLARQPG